MVCLNTTKIGNKREEPLATEYRTFVQHDLNYDLPPDRQVRFLDYDVKADK